jgi:hypothetical protein
LRQRDEPRSDRHRALPAEDIQENNLTIARAHAGVEAVKAAERPAGDGHRLAGCEGAPDRLGRGLRRKTDDAVGIGSRQQRRDLIVWAAGGRLAGLDHADDAHGPLEDAPTIDDPDKEIAGKQRAGFPFDPDQSPYARQEDLEAGQRSRFGGKRFALAEGADRALTESPTRGEFCAMSPYWAGLNLFKPASPPRR